MDKSQTHALSIAVPCAVIVLLIIIILVWCCRKKNKKEGHFDANMSTAGVQRTYKIVGSSETLPKAGYGSTEVGDSDDVKLTETLYVQPRLLDERRVLKPIPEVVLEPDVEAPSEPAPLPPSAEPPPEPTPNPPTIVVVPSTMSPVPQEPQPTPPNVMPELVKESKIVPEPVKEPEVVPEPVKKPEVVPEPVKKPKIVPGPVKEPETFPEPEKMHTGLPMSLEKPPVTKPLPNIHYSDINVYLLVVFLESLDEVVITIKEGKNFPNVVEPTFVRITCTKPDKTVEIQETTHSIGRVSPVWNEHLSFHGIEEEHLGETQFRVTAMVKRGIKWKELGSILIGRNCGHVTGDAQWQRVVAKSGIVAQWHQLANM